MPFITSQTRGIQAQRMQLNLGSLPIGSGSVNPTGYSSTFVPGFSSKTSTTTPTARPTARPTAIPTARPTARPTAIPTAIPTARPTATPTAIPTARPTATAPTASAAPAAPAPAATVAPAVAAPAAPATATVAPATVAPVVAAPATPAVTTAPQGATKSNKVPTAPPPPPPYSALTSKISGVPQVFYQPHVESLGHGAYISTTGPSAVSIIDNHLNLNTPLGLTTTSIRNKGKSRHQRHKKRGCCGSERPKQDNLKYIPCNKCPCKK